MKDRGVREGENSGWEELGTEDKGIWSTFLLSCSLLPEYPLFSCSCFGVTLKGNSSALHGMATGRSQWDFPELRTAKL